MAKSPYGGTNMKPTGGKAQVFPPDPAHPPQILPSNTFRKGGSYHKQKGANG
jgi:hypothetical protein